MPILDEYLVKLGAVVDTNSWSKFDKTLNLSEKNTTKFVKELVVGFGKFEIAAISAFTSVGVGLVSLADKTAMADQQYRLFGMRMLMTKESARSMQMATDNLGASLDQIAFDPELNAQFQRLYEGYNQLGKTLGPGFDRNMIGIRRLRSEFKFLGDELEVLAMGSISKLFDKLGYGSHDLFSNLEDLNTWFMTKIPGMSDSVSTHLVPVWNDFKLIVKGMKPIAESLGTEFIHLVGQLSGDDSLAGATLSWENFAKAIDHVVHGLTETILWSELSVKAVLHGVSAITDLNEASRLYMKGDKAGAEKFRDVAGKEASLLAADTHGILHPNDPKYGPDFNDLFDFYNPKKQSAKSTSSNDLVKAALQVQKDIGLPAGLVWGQWMQETDHLKNRGTTDLNNFSGIRIPGTKTYEKYDSIDSFVKAYEKVMENPKFVANGINSAKNADDFAHALKVKNFNYYEGPEKDYAAGIGRGQKEFESSNGGVIIENLHIDVPHALPEAQWAPFIRESMKDLLADRDRKTMAQTAGGAFH